MIGQRLPCRPVFTHLSWRIPGVLTREHLAGPMLKPGEYTVDAPALPAGSSQTPSGVGQGCLPVGYYRQAQSLIWFRSWCKYQVSHGIYKRCVRCQMSLSNQNLNGTLCILLHQRPHPAHFTACKHRRQPRGGTLLTISHHIHKCEGDICKIV